MFSRPQSFGFDLLFKTGFISEKLELNTQLSYQRDKIVFENIFRSQYFVRGFSKMVIGAKYLVYEQEYVDKTKEIRSMRKRYAFDTKRLIPSVAIYLGVNTDLVEDIHKTGSITPKVGVLLQNNLSNHLNIITNFYYDKIGSDFAELSYIVTATYSFSERWSTFIENQGLFQQHQKKINIGTGIAFLYNPNLQINASGRALFENDVFGYYAGLGISYRINRHQDPYIELDENGNKIEETPIGKYNKKQNGFFNRILNIFKGKSNKSTKRKRLKKSKKTKPKKKTKKEKEIEKLEKEIEKLDKKIKG